MADEDYDLDENQEQINKTELRIKNLSEKVKLTSEERDELARAKEQLENEKTTLAKEVDFYKNFAQVTSKYSSAGEYQEQIREKVMAGYDVEDAAIAILAREGKFATPAPEVESPAGGSASNTTKVGGEKSFAEMTQEERKAALIQAEAESGGLSQILRL